MFKLNTKSVKGFHCERRLMIQSQVLTEINPTIVNCKFKVEILSLHWNCQKILNKQSTEYFHFMVFVEDIIYLIRHFCEIKYKYGPGNRFKPFSRDQKSNPIHFKNISSLLGILPFLTCTSNKILVSVF